MVFSEPSKANSFSRVLLSVSVGEHMSDTSDRNLAIFFGSQTGNAEDLAEKTRKLASKLGLEATVFDMDGFNPADFSSHKRILIITSTWGEGEMPDNAEDLWTATCESKPSLVGVNYSVCAIGDTAYVDFCQAGIDWDQKFTELGGKRIYEIQLCDVDYEPEWKKWVDAVLPLMANDAGVGAAPSETPEAVDESQEEASGAIDSEEGSVEIPAEILEGDRNVLILVGSQSGNGEGLAETTAKLASLGHLNAEIKLMDSATVDDISNCKRLVIICSTWGEGEMPDNAQGLWDAAVASKANLSGVHYSVCALGDTSYEFYCQSGKDWDNRLEEMGATRVHDRVDCDVDYEPSWKSWVPVALGSLAALDESSNFHENLVSAFAEMIMPSKKAVATASAAGVVQPQIDVSVKVFRYDPVIGEQGWDTYSCSVPGHLSIAQLLVSIQETQDGSLSFRRSGTLSGLSINGRPMLADSCRVIDHVIGSPENLSIRIEPLPGNDVIRDLVVSTDAYENRRAKSKLWARTADRIGQKTNQGVPMGVMDTTTSVMLHKTALMSSPQLVQSWSDTLPHDPNYLGPAICAQLWVRYLDPRTSKKAREDIISTLEKEGGLWNETDISVMLRHGLEGVELANTLYDCRAELLRLNKFTGKTGRLVKNYSRSVKMSGNVNETTLYRTVLGPLGLVSNIMNGVSARMVLGFTRTGGPIMRGYQGMLVPPAGIGKIPDMFNVKIQNHHEMVAIFNEIDKRF